MKHTRRVLQAGFLALTLVGVFGLKANCEQWCPFGGVEALWTYAHEGNMLCSLGVANFYILGGTLLSVLLLRRAFCGYLCPIGTLSQWIRAAANRCGLPAVQVGARWDRVLSLVKYAVLAVILAATWRAGELVFRGYDPCYALLSRHGADITVWAYVTAGAVVLASLPIAMPFCRWFCPLAAVFNPLSRFGLARVKREESSCRGCGRCAAACPMAIPVDRVREVTASRCISCLRCADACPAKATGVMSWGPPVFLGRRWPQAILVAVLLACTGAAVAATYLAPLPSFVKARGQTPARVATLRLRMQELTCRGRANMLVSFLERDDLYQIPGPAPGVPGYYRLEAWPDPGVARVRISFDPKLAGEETIVQALTEPYFDEATNRWWMSPFAIEGYNPLSLGRSWNSDPGVRE